MIETIIDQLKNIPQIEHTRHRSTAGLASRLRTAGPDRAHVKENPDLFRIAREIDDLERRVAWTWLELWERHHRAMGEILRAILEGERDCLSSAYRRVS